ncbi:hypothetical protein, partial [Morganella morganii]|uniref:hypothetical protein n=1 Tax=Morganella morganii TaxID=582 RepID=UPI0021D1A5A0
RDPDLGKVVLYQLSYSRIFCNLPAPLSIENLSRYGERIIRKIHFLASPPARKNEFFCSDADKTGKYAIKHAIRTNINRSAAENQPPFFITDG